MFTQVFIHEITPDIYIKIVFLLVFILTNLDLNQKLPSNHCSKDLLQLSRLDSLFRDIQGRWSSANRALS
jgi:hypothetical protein